MPSVRKEKKRVLKDMAERKVELLVPAGSLEVLKVAVDYGADAVYIGGQAYGLRAKADNFSIEEMKKAVKYAHAKNAKVYVTANIFAHNYDIEGMKAYFEQLKDTGVDAVLVSDPGIFMLAKEIMPDMELHISTQANNTNYLTYNFWYNMGQNEWSQPESCHLWRLNRSENIFRRIWRLSPLCMEQCAFPILDAACSAVILQEEMQIVEHVHIHVDGSITL